MSSSTSNGDCKDETILPFQMDNVPELFQKKCEEELKETPENKLKNLQELKNIIARDKTTNGFNFEDDLLVQYLRHSKYDVERAFKHIHNYVILRNKHSHLFKNIPDDHFLSKNSIQFVTPLPKRTPDGCTIVVTQPGKWDPDEMDYDDLVRLSMMVFCQLMRDPMTQINGFRIIHDFKGTSLKHYMYCTPWKLHFLFYATIDCIPTRYKEIHFINESFVLRTVWNIIRRFLSEKIKNRVFFHSKSEELLDYFPRTVLPAEYGGDLQDDSMKGWVRKANKDHETSTMEGQPNYY